MSIPNISDIISVLEIQLNVRLEKVQGKKIFYSGKMLIAGQIIVCSPEARKQPSGFWWVDLTAVQIEFMRKAKFGVFAFRMEGDLTYFITLETLNPFLTKSAIKYNDAEGDHWKLHIWPSRIEVLGNSKQLNIIANDFKSVLSTYQQCILSKSKGEKN